MPFQLTHHFGALALTAVIDALVASIAWQRRGATLARTYFSLMMVAASVYATVSALEAGSVRLSDKIFWSTLEYVGSGGIIIFFLLFTSAFTHGHSRFKARLLVKLSLLPLLNLLIVATNNWHHLIWTAIVFDPVQSNVAVYKHGLGYFWVVGCIYLYVLRGMQLLARTAFSGAALQRKQAQLLILGSLFPFIGSALYSLDITPTGLNLTPMSFMATGVFFFWALFRMGAFDALPIARGMVIEHLRDGVLVVDLRHRIIDINPKGQLLTGLSSDCVGRSLHTVLSHLPELLQNYDQVIEVAVDLWLHAKHPRYITVQISPLLDYQGRLHGRLLVLHDITARYQAEVELRQANDCLQQQLEKIEFLQTKLQHQASRDQLTELFNRHYLNEILPPELQRAKQAGYSIGFMMLDIDHFKRINDTFGHRAGDLVLQAFSQIISQQIRSTDIPCRLGGEEFLLVLPGITLEAAWERAECIRQAFENSAIQWAESEVKTTVSGGIAIFPDHGTNDDDLLHAADLALYASKHSGRNQITCFNPVMKQSAES
ncbi:MAG TPA: histidine kinase N-terminal 7TM domain-containing protein [Microcoleaceae cyanobacterium]